MALGKDEFDFRVNEMSTHQQVCSILLFLLNHFELDPKMSIDFLKQIGVANSKDCVKKLYEYFADFLGSMK